jgi:uncharacterized protein YbjT (DUF2867 family)
MTDYRWFGLLLICGGVFFGLAPAEAQTTSGSQQTVLYAGATGSIGRIATRMLTNQGYVVRGITRNPERARERYGDAAQWVYGDVRDPEMLVPLMENADIVICSISYTEFYGANSPQFVDYMGVRNLVDAAKRHNIKQFIVVSAGSSGPYRDHTQNPRFGYVAYWKTKGEDYLKASGIPFTIIGPGGFNNDPGGVRGVSIFPRKNFEFGFISRTDVATVTVESIGNPDAINKAFAVQYDDSVAPGAWRDMFTLIQPE